MASDSRQGSDPRTNASRHADANCVMATRASLLNWIRWYCSLGITYPTLEACWHSAHFKYKGEGPPCDDFIKNCQALDYDVVRTGVDFKMQRVDK